MIPVQAKKFYFKSIFCSAVAICLLSFFTPSFCSQYNDGIYVSENSMIKLSVTIKNKKIASIKVIEHGGDPEYLAMTQPLIAEAIQNNSAEIDCMTGATVSSSAFKNALKDALEKAESGKD